MTLSKADIIDHLSRLDFPKNRADQLLETTLETVKTTLETGEDVLISGFGKFCVREKGTRRGRNPATGEALILEGRRVVTFKCSKVLKNRVNGKY